MEFACECVAAKGDYGDPWAPIAQKKLLPNGTKEKIINLVAREPRTIAQLAKLLHRSQPSIFVHVNELMTSELLRESEEWEKKYPAERYYEPNFPVIPLPLRAEFENACNAIAKGFADHFESNFEKLEKSFTESELGADGWKFEDVAQYFYAKVQREARKLLEESGILPQRKMRGNGVAWLFWAEEPVSGDGGSA